MKASTDCICSLSSFVFTVALFDMADMISASQLSTLSLTNDDTTLWLSVAYHSVYITTCTESHHQPEVEIQSFEKVWESLSACMIIYSSFNQKKKKRKLTVIRVSFIS